jgi:glycosyltransferase involved in cell wall biosynthesis
MIAIKTDAKTGVNGEPTTVIQTQTETRQTTPDAGRPSISVIVPVYNDEERLFQCLEALERQTYPKDLLEVLVVDNGSRKKITGITERFPFAQLLQEPETGSYAARNKGLSAARGEVIAFTDADCLPTPLWLENGLKALYATPGCGLVGGRIELFFTNPSRPTAAEIFDSLLAFPQKAYIEKGKWGATANVLTYRSVVEKVGQFDQRLRSGGDVNWGKRVSEAGYAAVFSEDAVVRHPARNTFRAMANKSRRVAGGTFAFHRNLNRVNLSMLWLFIITPLRVTTRPPFINSKKYGGLTKFKVFLVGLCLTQLRLFEIIRLALGGKPTR